MTTEEINKGSRLIENLMGSTIKVNQENVKDIPLAFLAVEDMKFHQSWKWLMPVVIKIEEDLGYPVLIEKKRCEIKADAQTFEHEEETKILAVWHAIVQFLEWREEQS